ncbi:hypothetical protein [Paenibacillus gallinarum]|uniref:Uncharacterized protein n=1 Tax=Paenibacillus gallinarum TaxID=2762232 RepID=A0ABR8T2L5_9BACL|nr:hypothetical protein [Paenibacillus gallinarum]MBD7970010.1 hypothetical protein [Paenibacillus gallinarum]
MISNPIIHHIAKDLKIVKIPLETEEQYFSRIIYSALAMWIRYSTLDEDILFPEKSKIGVSKTHIRNRCQPFIDEMIKMYPSTRQWFYPPDKESDPVGTVMERLCNAGELVEVGYSTDLALPHYAWCLANENMSIIRGIKNFDLLGVTGISQLDELTDNLVLNPRADLFSFYSLSKNTEDVLLNEILEKMEWVAWSNDLPYQLFNKFSQKNFSYSWDYEFKENDTEITLYRHPLYLKGNKDFGFVKKMDGKIYTSQLSEYFVETFEVRRYMYALRHSAGNSAKAKYIQHSDVDLVELHLYNGLPSNETKILGILGWPVHNIYDMRKLVFHISVWDFVKQLLSNLNISLEGSANGKL